MQVFPLYTVGIKDMKPKGSTHHEEEGRKDHSNQCGSGNGL